MNLIFVYLEERTIKLNALTLFHNLVRLLLLISVLVITFAFPYAPSIIKIYIGSNLSINTACVLYLRLSLINVLLNGVNGITESFIQSFMSVKQLDTYKRLYLLYSLMYVILCYIFMKYFGITGIMIINCLNLLGRIIINNNLINQYLIQIKFSRVYLFSSHYILLLIMSFIMCCLSQTLIESTFGQIIFTMGLMLTVISMTFLEERQMIHYIHCVLKLNYQN